MSRPLRIEYAGAVYHVTSRGNNKNPVFEDDHDREAFLMTLQHVIKRYHWICHTYCLMTNHYHLLIETPEGNLSLGMRQLNGVYTQSFNKDHVRTGHLFQGRYRAILIQKDSHLLEVCRYVVLNPVRARMVESPEDWKWSSFLAMAGKEKPHYCLTTDWILGQFSGKRSKAESEYQKFVKWGIGKETIWSEIRGQALLGKDDFVNALKVHLKRHQDTPDISRSQRFLTRPALSSLLPDSITTDRHNLKKKLTEAIEKYGYQQSQLARHLAVHRSTISRWLQEYENATKET